MKELLLSNPVLLVSTLLTFTLAGLIIFQLSKHRIQYLKLGKFAAIALIIILPGLNSPINNIIHPSSLLAPTKTLFGILLQTTIYSIVFAILRIGLRDILHSIVLIIRTRFLGVFLIFLCMSFLWSSDPWMTLKYSAVLIGVSIVSSYIAWKYSWSEILEFILWSSGLTALLSLLFAIVSPALAISSEGKIGLRGILSHPLHLGNVIALGASVLLIQVCISSKHRWVFLPLLFSHLLVMQLAGSAGAFISFLVSIAVCLAATVSKRVGPQKTFVVAPLFTIIGSAAIFIFASNPQALLESIDRDITLTGRIPLWQAIFSTAQEPLWFGYGYEGFWHPWLINDWLEGRLPISNPAFPVQSLIGDWAVHAHNGFIDIYLGLGLIGLFLFLFSFSFSSYRAIQFSFQSNQISRFLPLTLCVFIFFANLTESQLLTPKYIWFYYVIVAVKLSSCEPKYKLTKSSSYSPRSKSLAR